uniref:YqaJ viral recombinase domain-containing protein n=1 Tax=Eptatretus burgeri TaxID=7764 RepID=A0A8C4QFE3_EPTBU
MSIRLAILGSDRSRAIERETKNQRMCNSWFEYKSGRITASCFKAASRADPTDPSLSLIKQICYPGTFNLSTSATRWTCQHQEMARMSYDERAKHHHTELHVEDSGLHIHPYFPHLSASPDGLVQCTCCGKGIIETKCPFCQECSAVDDDCADGCWCMEINADGVVSLRKDHQYYAQVQAELFITGREYCDFVMILEKNQAQPYVERIKANNRFFKPYVEQVASFFVLGVLPELLGRWSTRAGFQTCIPITDTSAEMLWCYCKEPENARAMLKCSSASCSIQKFHQKCLGLKKKTRSEGGCA